MSDSTEQGSPEATKATPPTPPEVSKASIRKEVWDHFEDNDLANFPRPVHNRIPNFKDANAAAEKVKELDVFDAANTIKINPDKPQQHCRFLTLEANKTLLVPTPRLRTGLFNKIVPPAGAGKEELHICSTSQGIRDFSTKLGLDAEVKVDLVIVGSVAVSKQGFRIGKGEGFADLEYAMMVAMKAVNKDTVIVTTVHDCQVRDIPESLVEEHDITVDYIVTPTQVIKTECTRPKPLGIIWSKLDREKFRKVPILKKLREMERAEGKDVTLRDGETGEIPTEDESEGKENQGERPRRRGDRGQGRGARGGRGGGGYMRNRRRRPRTNSGRSVDGGQEGESGRSEDEGGEPRPPRQGGRGGGGQRDGPRRGPQRQRRAKRSHDPSVYIGGIPRNLRVSDFKTEIHGREVMPIRVVWHGGSGHAFLQFQNVGEAEAAVDILKDLEMKGKTMKVELARSNTAPPGKEGSGLESGGESGNAKEKLVDSAGGDQD